MIIVVEMALVKTVVIVKKNIVVETTQVKTVVNVKKIAATIF